MRFGVNALRLWGQRLGTGRIDYLLKEWASMLDSGGRHTKSHSHLCGADLFVHSTRLRAFS